MVVRRKYEAGTGQIGSGIADTPNIDEVRYRQVRDSAVQPPTAPTWNPSPGGWTPPSTSNWENDPRLGYASALRGAGAAGYQTGAPVEPYVPRDAQLMPGDTYGERLGRVESSSRYRGPIVSDAKDNAFGIKSLLSSASQAGTAVIEQRANEASMAAGNARSLTASLQAQVDSLRMARENALQSGLAATAAQYNEKLQEIQAEIDRLNREGANQEQAAAWLQGAMTEPFDLAAAAAQAIDTAGATAAAEAAVANLTAAKLEADGRVAAALEEIGFYGEAGAIGIADAQRLMGEAAFFEESLGVLEAQGAYQQEMADFQKDLAVANADEIEAAFRKDVEGNRMIASKKIRDSLTAAMDDQNKVEAAKERALQAVRDDVAREYGEGITLPSKDEYLSYALKNTWAQVGNDLGGEEMFSEYAEYALELVMDGVPLDVRGITNWLNGLNADLTAAGRENVDFDDEDLVILRQMSQALKAASDEWDRTSEFQGSQTGADNLDPYNQAEVKRWLDTGEITGPYAERAAMTTSIGKQLRTMGFEVQGMNYMRPASESTAEKGRAVNSDHICAGALDVFFRDGVKDAQYQELMAMVNGWKQAGVVSSVVDLGANQAHKDHVHISFALPYGEQKNFEQNGQQYLYNSTLYDPAVGR